MSPLQAHLICIALVVVDLVTRAWRFQWILRGMRFKVPFMEVLALNTVGDAASAVTPLRLGGENCCRLLVSRRFRQCIAKIWLKIHSSTSADFSND